MSRKKEILKDLKKNGCSRKVIKEIKKTEDLEEIAYILLESGFSEIFNSHYNIQEIQYYWEKWLDSETW